MSTETAELKERAHDAIVTRFDELVSLSRRLHADPELAFAERRSAASVADALEMNGFAVDRGVGDLPTAFSASVGNGSLAVAICAEYDALPGVGHACGHNLIAAAAVAAGAGLASCADELDMTVKVVGTPAEEGGAGKATLLDAGVFDGVHVAMMVHPYPEEIDAPLTRAAGTWRAVFTGRGAHAGMAPERGVNAGDAATLAQVAIGLLRQQLPSSDRVHCVVAEGAGPMNIIPARAVLEVGVRTTTLGSLEATWKRVRRCITAGAHATGAEVNIEALSPAYAHFEADQDLLRLYHANATRLGRTIKDDLSLDERLSFSTDMANVSLRIPAIHPMIRIDADGASNHEPRFAAACVTPPAERAVILDGGSALAATAIDAARTPAVRERLLAGRRRVHPDFPTDN